MPPAGTPDAGALGRAAASASPPLSPGAGRERVTGRLLVLTAGLCMSLGGLIVRLTGDIGEWQFLFYRSLGAALLLAGYFQLTGRSIPALVRRAGWPGLVGGIGLCMAFFGFVWGVMHSTVANTLFLLSAAPVLAAFLGWLVLRELVAPSLWLSMGGVVLGVGIMIWEGIAESDLLGDLAALASALGFAAFTVSIRYGRQADMAPAILIGATIAALVSGVLALATGAGLAAPLWDVGLAFFYGMLIIAAGIFLFTLGSRHVPAGEAVLLCMTEVVFGPVWVWLAFAETPGHLTLIGGLVILGSVAAQAAVGMRRP